MLGQPPLRIVGGGERDRLAAGARCPGQPHHQIGREERRVPGGTRDMGIALGRSPAHPLQDTSQRPGKALHGIRHHRQAELGEAGRVAIGVQHHLAHLRLQPGDDARQQRLAAEPEQRLVAAPHAPGKATGEDYTCDFHATFASSQVG